MIEITKEEAMALRAKYGNDVHIAITNRKKKGGRKKYYAAEEKRNVYFIERYRNEHVANATAARKVAD